ncbi:histidine phosphatase family protein LALA0_S08e04192g [Lachancea lanzarotensis]|uniref:acid phosphatase n=1 Tax=Lachancea lanzarotensis TaxID=1245769 RepID=A0A0C7NAN5_9SACH|nr:uncharacterized protein LALA0_S08e04192g [Lachancea lanzarotensis]CEP63512.1 LALA0S08e04192g1_1 [Lachancea lanzarotensis]
MNSVSLVLLAAALANAAPATTDKQQTFADVSKIGTQEDIFPYLAGSAPHFSYPLSYGVSKEVPDQCVLQQVQLFARHGERYPTNNTGASLTTLYKKLNNYSSKFSGALEFLDDDYEFFLPDPSNFEELTTWNNILDPINPYVGEWDAQKHGREFFQQYGELLKNKTSFPIFTSNSKRVHDTAKFFGDALGDKFNISYQIIDEDPSMGANSLTTLNSCATYNKTAKADVYSKFTTKYLSDIANRLNTENKGLNLSKSEANSLFAWCAYEINVKGYSNMCDVFTDEELTYYAYNDDMTSYYYHGPGNPLGITVGGVNFNASVELLKQHKELDNKVWLSFTHDTNVVNILAAIGIFDPGHPMPAEYIAIKDHIYHKSWMVPQGARVYTQLYQCSNQTYVRYVVNDAVIPIEKCSSGPGLSCELSKFVDYAESRLNGTDYVSSCKTNTTSNQTSLTFYWDYQQKHYDAPLGLF